MRDEGNWGRSGDLEARWWSQSPPTAIIRASGKWQQLSAVLLVRELGYSPSTNYVFGATLGPDRFFTGSYEPGPIDWTLQRLSLRPSPTHLIGLRVLDRHRGLIEDLAAQVPRINAVMTALDRSRVLDVLPDELADPAGMLVKFATLVSSVDVDPGGYEWPPVPEGGTWARRSGHT